VKDVAAREPVEATVVTVARGRTLPALDLEALHPECVHNEYTEQVWVRAISEAIARAYLLAMWGGDYMSYDDINSLELEPEWMRPELIPRDHELYAESAAECGDPDPIWYVPAPEASLGAALYWRYDP
jgi:hypothetical protein